MNEKLLEWIKKNLERGHDSEKIKNILINAGHDISVVEEHINQVIKLKKNKKYMQVAAVLITTIIILGISINYFSGLNKSTKFQKNSEANNTNRNTEINCNEECRNKNLFNQSILKKNLSICLEITDNLTQNQCKQLVMR